MIGTTRCLATLGIASLLLGACRGAVATASPATSIPTASAAGSPGLTAAASPIVTVAASGPPPSPAPTASPSTFVSPRYGYSIALPAGWSSQVAAFGAWDGAGSPGHESFDVDQFVSASGVQAWAFAGSTRKTTPEFWRAQLDAAAIDHPCSTTLAIEDEADVTIDGLPARLTVMNCPGLGGIRVAGAAVVHDGSGYVFYLQDSTVETSASFDRGLLEALLAGVRLP